MPGYHASSPPLPSAHEGGGRYWSPTRFRSWLANRVLDDGRRDERWLRDPRTQSCARLSPLGSPGPLGIDFLGCSRCNPRSGRTTAEFKHINKRRKRNLQGFP